VRGVSTTIEWLPMEHLRLRPWGLIGSVSGVLGAAAPWYWLLVETTTSTDYMAVLGLSGNRIQTLR